MNTQFECTEQVNGLLTVTLEPADYQEAVTKKLKEVRKKAQMPGFRPGMIPIGLIKKQFGTRVKLEEVNRLVSECINKYINDNKIKVLGSILPSEKQKEQNIEAEGPLEFIFDIAIAPEIKVELTNKDKLDFYQIIPDDKLIDEQVSMFAAQAGQMVEAEEWSGNDTLIGDLRQLDADGNTLEGGMTTQNGEVMPSYIKDEEQKKKFEGAKPGDVIIFNPKKTYPSDTELAGLLKVKKDEVKDLDSDFSFQVTSIRHFQPAEVNEELFKKVFGEDCKDKEDFRQRIAKGLERQLSGNGDYKFMLDIRKYLEEKVGNITMPEAILKRVMLDNNRDKENAQELVEKNFEGSIKELKWHLIKEQLVEMTGIKVEDADLKSIAKDHVRQHFAQYGMSDVPDDLLEQYAEEQLKNKDNTQNYVEQIIDQKLAPALKQIVKLNTKEVTIDEFRKLMEA
jgi:trigger factor